MYGVYTFLEKLGCRWFTPDLSRIPKRRTIAIASVDERHTPSFEYREPYFREAFDKDWNAALPYTMLIAPGGEVLYKTQGQIDALQLKRAIVSALKPDR